MNYIHPVTNEEYSGEFIGCAVYSNMETPRNPNGFIFIKCVHEDYKIAKEAFDKEVEEQKKSKNNHAKSVIMIHYTRHGPREGFILHEWKN